MKSFWIKLMVGTVLIGGALVYFGYTALRAPWSYYLSVDDFTSNKAAATHTLRLAGKVQKGSIARNLEQMQLNFNLAGSQASVPVSYHGTVPDNFAEDRDVVVEGRLDPKGTFQADKLLTRCESKYQAKK
jgi:cytochrome c-type biogenesis protein CcmE